METPRVFVVGAALDVRDQINQGKKDIMKKSGDVLKKASKRINVLFKVEKVIRKRTWYLASVKHLFT